MCADKANKLGIKAFCFLLSDAKERSVPGSAQSVPTEQCQTHASLEVCQSRATSVNSYGKAEGAHKDQTKVIIVFPEKAKAIICHHYVYSLFLFLCSLENKVILTKK